MEFVQLSKDEFSNFAEKHTVSFLQTGPMTEFLQERGYQVMLFAVKKDQDIKAAGLVTSLSVFGGLKMEMNFGPFFENDFEESVYEFFIENLKEFARQNQALELAVRPSVNYLTFDSKGEKTSKENAQFIENMTNLDFRYKGRHVGYDEQDAVAEWQYIKDISDVSNEEELLKTYNSNAKRNIKKAVKNEIYVKIAEFNELDQVERLIKNTGNKRNFATKDLNYYQAMYEKFSNKIEFLITYSGDVAIAAGVFIQVNKEYLYLYGGSDGAYGKLGGPFLMQHKAILQAIEYGMNTYNFYGISGKFDGSDGVLKFKQNFGGYITQKIGEFIYYPKPLKAKSIQLIKKITGRK
ncbi:MAG: aminoacyltransferase [Streptococcaceae bacterium]|nr:aminoacyltransferase [Streptococcaceae bacterium]MCL2681542.1 aminoacyltransferase [Streptococcaceae bacterium]MCL2858856.1 aminoacyltransferase [Streptococcaceae bacterium]